MHMPSSCCCLSTELSLYLCLHFLISVLIFAFCFSLFPDCCGSLIRYPFLFLLRRWIQSFLWPPPAGVSRYLSRDFLGLPHSVQPPINAVNLLVTSAVNCTPFSSLRSSRFRGGMLCCLCLLASLTFRSPQATDGLCHSLLLDTCNNSSNWFSIFAQWRCSLSDSRCCHQECLGTFPEIFWGYLILCSLQSML